MSTDNNQSAQEIAAKLLADYAEADKEVLKAKASLEEANKKRSDVVKEIHGKLGKGPFTYKGEHLGKIVIRGNTFFFRGRNEEGGVKVE
jgi:hypothetical protein